MANYRQLNCGIIGKEVFAIEFQQVRSPKEYNFKNDSADVEILPNIDNIQSFIYKNKESFVKYLKSRYTSYDGFISFYENDFESWEQDTKKFTDFNIDNHRLGSILDFIYEQLEIDFENDVYYRFKESIFSSNYIENYDELEEKPSCGKCFDIIKNDDIVKDFNKFKLTQGIYPKTCYCENCLDNQ